MRLQHDPRATGCVDPACPQRFENALAGESLSSNCRQSTRRVADLCDPGVSVVCVSTADKTQPVAAVERIADEVSGHGVLDHDGCVRRLAAAVNRSDLGDGFEVRIGWNAPIGRDRTPRRVMRERQSRGAGVSESTPQQHRSLERWVHRAEQLAAAIEVQHVSVAVYPVRPFETQ